MSFDLQAQLQRLDALERATDAWEPEQRELLMELRALSDGVQAEAWRRTLRALQQHAGVAEQLQGLAADPVVYAALRRFGLLKASLDERIAQALVPVRPLLQAHGGDVEVVEILPPDRVHVRMTGACDGCPASAVTLTAGVIRAIRSACPEITEVRELSSGRMLNSAEPQVSPFDSAEP